MMPHNPVTPVPKYNLNDVPLGGVYENIERKPI
jgi:hypothetical protein